MPALPHWSFWLGLVVLVAAWAGPLPGLVGASFAAHMTLHVVVVAVAAPLIAFGLVGSRADPTPRVPPLFAAIPAALVELVLVWAWHTPVLHRSAVGATPVFLAEQVSFLAAGLLVWLAALAPDEPKGGLEGGPDRHRRGRALAGVVALLFTSMHMTLLGALIGLAPRPLFHRPETGVSPLGLSLLEDQQLGGIVMLAVGGAAYLAGGLILIGRLLGGEPGGLTARR